MNDSYDRNGPKKGHRWIKKDCSLQLREDLIQMQNANHAQ